MAQYFGQRQPDCGSPMNWKKLRALLTAAVPHGVVSAIRRRRDHRESMEKRAAFWKRNNRVNLERYSIQGAMAPPSLPPVLQHRVFANWTAEAISYADQCGLLEFLSTEPGRDLSEIRQRFGFGERQAGALLDLLHAAEIVLRRSKRYTTTPAARVYLLPDSPLYIGDQLPESPVTDEKMSGRVTGVSSASWAAGESHEPEGWGWNQHSISFKLGFALASTGLLDGHRRILDVAGGAGSVCIALAIRYPDVRATVLELPESVEVAKKMIAGYELEDRIDCVGQDMFQGDWPGGFDAVLFTNILHDWDPEKCLVLAKRAHASLRPGGRVLIQEALLAEDGPGPLTVSAFSLRMALEFGAQQLRESELNGILADAGFRGMKAHALFGHHWTVVATRD